MLIMNKSNQQYFSYFSQEIWFEVLWNVAQEGNLNVMPSLIFCEI